MSGFLPWPEGDDRVLQCADGQRPRVSTNGERVVKVYDLRLFDDIEMNQLRFEGETALALRGIPGVVTTYRAAEVGDEYVIEMELLGHSLTDYLGPGQSSLPTISRERWGLLFEQVAKTLEEIHRRGLTHQDVKPANLLFDRAGERLVVTDFSVSSRRTRLRRAVGQGGLAGTPAYIAPEQHDGRSGPKADQFALARTADQILGSDQSPQTKRVLLRATSQEPEERYARIADFGAVLHSTLSDDARRMSTRIQTLPPQVRHAWAPAIATTMLMYLALLLLRNPRLNVAGAIVIPLATGVVTQLALTLLSFRLTKRTQPWLKLANRGWFPPAVAGSLIAVLWPLIEDNPERNAKYAFYAAMGALWLTAALRSVPRDAGDWLVGIVRLWERWQDAHRFARWPAVGVTVSVAGLLAVAPVAVAAHWPRVAPASEIAAPEPIALVAHLREAMLTGEPRQVCALVSVPASAEVAPCGSWAPVAARQLKTDVHAGGPRFVPSELDRVGAQYLPDSTSDGGAPGWDLRTSGENREYLGYATHPVGSQTAWAISVTRVVKRDNPLPINDSEWKYEVVLRQGVWRISAVEVCDYHAEPACQTLSQLSPAELDAYQREEAP
jgi:serine/threonine protein kinase